MTAPDVIQAPIPPGHVFVFGSNIQGLHGAGAAAYAFAHFGAVIGEGDGLQGQSYALPTMEGWEALEDAVERFLTYATEHPWFTFLLTPVGCGIAGYTPAQVAPLFKDAPDNVDLPSVFEKELGR